MNYFRVSFTYRGFRDPTGVLAEPLRCLEEAKGEAEKVMSKLGLDYRLELAWPDGTLRFYVKTDMANGDLRQELWRGAWSCKSLRGVRSVETIHPDEPSVEMDFGGYPTLRAFFEEPLNSV